MIVRLDLPELQAELGEEANRIVLELANELVNQLKVEAPVGATGDLQRSFQIFQTGDGVVFLGTRIHYALDVLEGTEPHTPDFDAIEVWARRKLGDESLAGPVFRTIQQEGTEPNDYLGRAIDETVDRVTQ